MWLKSGTVDNEKYFSTKLKFRTSWVKSNTEGYDENGDIVIVDVYIAVIDEHMIPFNKEDKLKFEDLKQAILSLDKEGIRTLKDLSVWELFGELGKIYG